MKIAFGLIALVIVVLAVAFFAGGFSSPSIAEQVQNFNAKVQPGMTWEQVLAVTQPKQWSGIATVQTEDGMETQTGQPTRFVLEQAKQSITGGTLEGFVFYYSFSPEENYEVHFNAAGKVTGPPERQRSMGDLMDLGGTR